MRRQIPVKILKILLVGITIIVTETTASADWLTHYRSGEDKLRLDRIEEARRDLRSALAEAESSQAGRGAVATILEALGRVQFRSGQFRDATHSFERALQLWDAPAGRFPVLCNAAQAFREAGDHRRAEERVREAIEIAPDEPRAWQLLGSVLILRRRYAEAEAAEGRALAKGGQTVAASVWSDLAEMHKARGRYGASAKALERALETAARGHVRARLLANLGEVELKLRRVDNSVGRLSEALQEMESAIGLRHPDAAKMLEMYSAALRQAGRKPEAKQAAHRAKEIRSLLSTTVDWRDLK